MKIKHFDCAKMCREYKTCVQVCDFINIIADGSKPLKESFPDYLSKKTLSRNYNEVLSELISAADRRNYKEPEYIEAIRRLSDIKIKAITALLYARVPQDQIAVLFKISDRQMRRMMSALKRTISLD